MAIKSRSSSAWQMLHFLLRFIGLVGLMTAIGGWFVWGVLKSDQFDAEEYGMYAIQGGLGAVAFALLFELAGFFRMVFSNRGAFGINAMLQVVLMLALVVGANYYAFHNFKRFDLTEDQIFTLDEKIHLQLANLRGDTDIIIFQNHRSFGHRAKDESDKDAQRAKNQQEKIDFAAQRKIIEKVKDLAEQFGDLGPRFHVHVLDMKDDGFDKAMAKVRDISADLENTILSAPENSVFFYSRDLKQAQRLSFSEIYQVDTQSSLEQKNLVLHYQGEEPFVNKIFSIEQKSPRIATAVIHPVLGMQNKEMPMFTMSGAKTTLGKYNIGTLDLMMRKIGDDGDLSEEPTALTYDESRFEQIEDELVELDELIKVQTSNIKEMTQYLTEWKEWDLPKLNTKYIYYYREDGRQDTTLRANVDQLKKSGIRYKFTDVDEVDKKNETEYYSRNIEILQTALKRNREERESLSKEKATLNVETLAEKRRLTDVEAKTKAMLANVDLLIVPRITMMNAATGRVIPNRIHKLDTTQLNALKAFMREGKPVLFLLGPANDPRETPELGGGTSVDPLESMLAELGFKLPKQTILYNVEAREFNERKFGGAFGGGNREVEVPGLKLDVTTMTTQFTKVKDVLTPHPLRTSLKMMSRSGGKSDAGELRIKHPRPVYYMKPSLEPNAASNLVASLSMPGFGGAIPAAAIWLNQVQQKPDENSVFLITRDESWNEDHPFIVKNKAPSYTPPKSDDPRKGTVEEPRLGPFPIGVAVETPIPADWYETESTKPKTARIAVIGSGSAFVGTELTPMKERMLLDVVNWLIGRDDLLAKEAGTWQYPRVAIPEMQFQLWQWGARLWLPLVFVFLGVVVTMARQMR
jgi:hypothetical protein